MAEQQKPGAQKYRVKGSRNPKPRARPVGIGRAQRLRSHAYAREQQGRQQRKKHNAQ